MAILCSLLWTLDEAYAKFTFLVTLDRKKIQVISPCFLSKTKMLYFLYPNFNHSKKIMS